MSTKIVTVTKEIRVTLDESKFTDEFMEEFREVFYDFKTIEDHRLHLAFLFANNFVSDSDCFAEGYGVLSEFGVTFFLEHQEEALQ